MKWPALLVVCALPAAAIEEITLTAVRDLPNPYKDATITAVFAGPAGQLVETRGFWDGGRTYKVRFTAPVAGRWTYRISAAPADRSTLSTARIVCRGI